MTRTTTARWLRLIYRSYRSQGLTPACARAVALLEINARLPF